MSTPWMAMRAVARGSLRPIVDEALDPEQAAVAHRRVETGHGQGKVVLCVVSARPDRR
jgi:NADPH:quinone reductase-like Zn-dependent oxidoreductase